MSCNYIRRAYKQTANRCNHEINCTHRTSNEISDRKRIFAQQYAQITTKFKAILGSSRQQTAPTPHLSNRSVGSIKSIKSMGSKQIQKSTPKNLKLQSIILLNKQRNRTAHSRKQSKLPASQHINTEIFVEFEKQKQEKINKNFKYISELISHFKNILKIRECLEDHQNKYKHLVKGIKKYVLNYQGADVNHLDQFLKIQREKTNLRLFLCLEKAVVIGIMDSITCENQSSLEFEGKSALDIVLGVYFSIIDYLISQNLADPQVLSSSSLLGIKKRKDLSSTNKYLLLKVNCLFRFNPVYLSKIKSTIEEMKESGYKVNLTFYLILGEYAKYLNTKPDLLMTYRDWLCTFATCPSPHLAFKRVKGKYTVVLQFEGVLCVSGQKGHFKMRPFSLQLVQQIKKLYEVIIITKLLPSNFEQIPQIFSLADSLLYKYHLVRYRETLVKDVSRLGRRLEEIIVIDEDSSVCLNQRNLLIVDKWTGDQYDNDLQKIQEILIKIACEDPMDVRESLEKLFYKNKNKEKQGKNSERISNSGQQNSGVQIMSEEMQAKQKSIDF